MQATTVKAPELSAGIVERLRNILPELPIYDIYAYVCDRLRVVYIVLYLETGQRGQQTLGKFTWFKAILITLWTSRALHSTWLPTVRLS